MRDIPEIFMMRLDKILQGDLIMFVIHRLALNRSWTGQFQMPELHTLDICKRKENIINV